MLSGAALGLWEKHVEQEKLLDISTIGSGAQVAVSALLSPGWDFEEQRGLLRFS